MRDMYIEGNDAARIVKALSNNIRLEILDLLNEREMSIQVFCKRLNLSKTAVINHLNILESAGFITARVVPGAVGNQKLYQKAHDRLIFNFTPQLENEDRKQYYEIELSPGNYFDFLAYPPCGLVDEAHIIQKWDDPSVFFGTERVNACLVWMSYGFLEYRVPLNIPFEDLGLEKVNIQMEISAQGGLYEIDMNGVMQKHDALHFPDEVDPKKAESGMSDITISLGGRDLVTVTVEDFSRYQHAGRYTPTWWRGSGYGKLVSLTVDSQGTFMDGQQVSMVTLDKVLNRSMLIKNRAMKVSLSSGDYIPLRVGIHSNAQHISGLTLFGKGYGNYPHGILVRFY